ncbi:MAG: hypothetical protein IPF42_16970 [Candidatus Microthrix sp.]|nr:hypothetical protein [Candidatus Microthrix sp.]
MFEDIHHMIIFGYHIYGRRAGPIHFQASYLLHPDTLDGPSLTPGKERRQASSTRQVDGTSDRIDHASSLLMRRCSPSWALPSMIRERRRRKPGFSGR